MPVVARHGEHLFIHGPGLDEVLAEGYRILLFDPVYSDVYGDYVFLGYEVVEPSIRTDRADLVGLYVAASLLEAGPAVAVCGEDHSQCLLALAASIVLRERKDAVRALEEAARALKPLYGSPLSVSQQSIAALETLRYILDKLGDRIVSALLGLALNYEYGHGQLHYGEAAVWALAIEKSLVIAEASLLHFMIEGHGTAWELYERRLDAIGRDNLRLLLGAANADAALRVLEELAYSKPETREATILALVEALGPGSEHTLHVAREGSNLIVHCRRGSLGEPDKDCVGAVHKAAKYSSSLGLRIRIATGEPQPLQLG